MNTKNRGSVELFLFKEADGDYCAVCLTLNLIEWGKDPEKLIASINEAIQSYVEGVIKKGLPDELLNRPAPEKYWQMARKSLTPMIQKMEREESTKLDFFSFINKPYSHGSFISA